MPPALPTVATHYPPTQVQRCSKLPAAPPRGGCGSGALALAARPDDENRERFPEAGGVVCGDFAEVLRGLPIDSNTYVVTVTRGHKHDEESLRQVAESPAA